MSPGSVTCFSPVGNWVVSGVIGTVASWAANNTFGSQVSPLSGDVFLRKSRKSRINRETGVLAFCPLWGNIKIMQAQEAHILLVTGDYTRNKQCHCAWAKKWGCDVTHEGSFHIFP